MWQQSLVNYLEALESETLSNSFQIANDLLSVICDIDFGDPINWNRSIASRYSMQDFELMNYCNENPESEFRSKVIKVKDVSIYPNPSTVLTTIDIPKDEIISELRIQDIQGKNIYQSNNIINNLFNLNVNGAPGLYIVRMKFEDGDSIIKKLVIQ